MTPRASNDTARPSPAASFFATSGMANRYDTAVRFAVLVVLAIVFLFPFFWMASTSLKSNLEALKEPTTLFPDKPVWDNYPDVWDAMRNFPRQMENTAIMAFGVTFGQILICAMAGYAFARMQFVARDPLFVLLLATLIVPFEAIYVPIFIKLSDWGLVDTYAALILPSLGNPFAIFIFRQFFRTIPIELEEAMLVDGAGRFRLFFRLYLPLSGPAVASVFILTFLAEWNALLKPLVFTTSQNMYTVQRGLVFLDRGAFVTEPRIAWLIAGVVIASIPPIVVFLLGQRRFIESVASTGLKG